MEKVIDCLIKDVQEDKFIMLDNNEAKSIIPIEDRMQLQNFLMDYYKVTVMTFVDELKEGGLI